MTTFLRSVGLENCQTTLMAGGFTSLESGSAGDLSPTSDAASRSGPVHTCVHQCRIDYIFSSAEARAKWAVVASRCTVAQVRAG